MSLKTWVRSVSYRLFKVEHPRLYLEQLMEKLYYFCLSPWLRDPALYSDLTDCFVRVRISNRCNCKCKFCALRCSSTPNIDMDQKWILEYCAPLYAKAKLITFTSGEFLTAPHAYENFSRIAEQYPQATIVTESNGIGFDEKWQDLAVKHLFRTCFSMNAVTEETFVRAVWENGQSGAENAFRLSRQNIRAFIQKLEERGLLAFAPSVSMVITQENMHETLDFLRMALQWKAGACQFFFDVTSQPSDQPYFSRPEIHALLLELAKLKRLLKERFLVKYDLFIPWKEAAAAEQEVAGIPEETLRTQYLDFYDMAEARSIEREYRERTAIQEKCGKKTFTLAEDIAAYIHTIDIAGKPSCFAAWKMIDIYEKGGVQFCGWQSIFVAELQNYIRNGRVDWVKLYNTPKIRHIRKQMLKGDFSTCMKSCPVIRQCTTPQQ